MSEQVSREDDALSHPQELEDHEDLDDDDVAERDTLDAPVATFEELCIKFLPTVAARIWNTCCWPERMQDGWKIGDYRFLVISIQPEPDAEVYLQFWSEPHEDVPFEVSSGEWSPPTVKFVQERQRGVLRGLGFEIGGRARNFRKIVSVRNVAEAETVAREVLRILFEAFDYRGQWPLAFKAHRGERAARAPVHSSLTPEDFIKLLVEHGYTATLRRHEGAPQVRVDDGHSRFLARLHGQVPEHNLYTTILLDTFIPGLLSETALLRLNARFPELTIRMYDDHYIQLSATLPLEGGVTEQWILHAVRRWAMNVRRCAVSLKRAMRRDQARGNSEPAVH